MMYFYLLDEDTVTEFPQETTKIINNYEHMIQSSSSCDCTIRVEIQTLYLTFLCSTSKQYTEISHVVIDIEFIHQCNSLNESEIFFMKSF